MSTTRATADEIVTDLVLSAYTIPTEAPESDGTLTWDHTTVVVVEVSGGGVTGLGFTYGPMACASVIDETLRGCVVGHDADAPPAAWERMVRAIRNAGRPGIASMAIAAVDVALWDLAARSHGTALHRHLGAFTDRVPVYGSGGFTSLSEHELLAQLTGWADQGMTRVKMKVGTGRGADPRTDLARAGAARRALGDGIELFVDANGAYDEKQAIGLAARYESLGVTWFEEPVSSDALANLADIRRATSIDIAAGEYGYDLVYFARMCAAGAVDVLQADVTRCAGITEWRRAAAVAAGHGLQISGHCAPSTHAHVACTVPNLAHLEYFADHTRTDRLLFDGVLDPVDGFLVPDPDAPGHGLTLRRADAERWQVA